MLYNIDAIIVQILYSNININNNINPRACTHAQEYNIPQMKKQVDR